MLNSTIKAMIALLGAGSLATSASAASDPVGDFLETYTGPRDGHLDFTDAQARFDGSAFLLKLTVNEPISPDFGAVYVWGIDRGAGVPRLNLLFDPDLNPSPSFDSLAALFTDGTVQVVTFPLPGAPTRSVLPGGAVFDGNTVSASIDLELLPSLGFAPTSYEFQPWARLRTNPAVDGPNTEIADVGPRTIAAVPEPATWMTMLIGFAILGRRVGSVGKENDHGLQREDEQVRRNGGPADGAFTPGHSARREGSVHRGSDLRRS